MNDHRRDVLVACLNSIFGDGHDAFVNEALPLLSWVELNGGQTLVKEGDPLSGILDAHGAADGAADAPCGRAFAQSEAGHGLHRSHL
jgi:hypothetical protein